MSLTSAQQFVARMKEDKEFRRKVQSLPSEEALKDFIKAQGYEFDQQALVGAMAACMSELDIMMESMKNLGEK